MLLQFVVIMNLFEMLAGIVSAGEVEDRTLDLKLTASAVSYVYLVALLLVYSIFLSIDRKNDNLLLIKISLF